MENLTVNSFLTSREAGKHFGKHELTINKIMSQHFKENEDYRFICSGGSKKSEMLIKVSSLEDFFNNPAKYKVRTTNHNKTHIPDRDFRI